MLALVLVLLSQVQPDSRVTRVERVPGGRMEGGRGGVMAYAFFEAFPANGRGTFGACSTTPPTGAKGEVLTFARTGSATCTATATGGLATSGIANGDLVELSGNQPRVEYDSGGVKGLRVEASRVNSLFRFIECANATWADVGTPTLTGSQASPFTGTYAASAVQFDDNDGAAFEGRSQVVAVTAATAYYAHCYVKAGTATSARISLDGTAATITGLSSSTWSIVEVADASASGATVTFEVDVGSTAAAVGTVTFGGCQIEAGTYRTSIIPTTSAAVTRNAELARFNLPTALSAGSTYCFAATGDIAGVVSNATLASLEDTWGTANPPLLVANDATANARCYGAVGGNLNTGATYATGLHRLRCDSTRVAKWDATSASGASTTLSGTSSHVGVGAPGNGTNRCDCITSQVQLDSAPSRCR